MSTDVAISNNDSINMDGVSELSPTKTIETMKAKNLIMNAILIGIQNAINRRGEEHNVPPSIRKNMLNEIQNGGGPVFSALKTAKDVYNYKKTAAKQLEKLGVDKKTTNALRSASSLRDAKNIGIKSLKRFGNVPPPPPQRFGSRTLKRFKQKLGLIKEEPETLTKDDLKRIGVEGLKRMGINRRLGISDEQLMNVDSLSPDKIKQMGKQVAIEKLRNSGILNKLGMSEDELKTLNISQIKQLGKQQVMEKLSNSGILNQLGISNEQAQNMSLNDIKRIGMEKIKQLSQKSGVKSDSINNLLRPDNPDFQKETGVLAANKLFSNTKNMYVGLIKKIIIVSDFFTSKLIDFVTQGALDTPITELTANTNKRVLVLAAYLREVANNPEQMKAIQEISEALGVMGIEFIDTIKPSIDKIIDKLIESSQQVGSKSAFGAVQTFFTIASSMIAAVPGIGGIVDMIISIAMAFNTVMRIARTFVESNSEVAVDGAEAAGKTVGTVKKNSSKIMDMVNRLKQSVPSAVPTQAQDIPFASQIENEENIPIASQIDEDEDIPIAYPDEVVDRNQVDTNYPAMNNSPPPYYGPPSKVQPSDQNGGKGSRMYYTSKSNSNKMSKSRKRIESSVLRFKTLNGNKNCHSTSSRTRKCIHY
jgi:uncharacterized protein YidB (DUF937 family)